MIEKNLGRVWIYWGIINIAQCDSAIVFLTNNDIVGGVNNPHGTMVTWVHSTIWIGTNSDLIENDERDVEVAGMLEGEMLNCSNFIDQSNEKDDFMKMDAPCGYSYM